MTEDSFGCSPAAGPLSKPLPDTLTVTQEDVKQFLDRRGFAGQHLAVFQSLTQAQIDEHEWLSTLNEMPGDILRQLVHAAVTEHYYVSPTASEPALAPEPTSMPEHASSQVPAQAAPGSEGAAQSSLQVSSAHTSPETAELVPT
eukprot:SAG31_NODE_15927_length_731_cov_1.200949_2_plen_143_part_01